MKKLIILLIIVLAGIYFVNILSNTSKTQEITFATIVSSIGVNVGNMTKTEVSKLKGRVTTEELDDAQTLIREWNALVKIAAEANKIILER